LLQPCCSQWQNPAEEDLAAAVAKKESWEQAREPKKQSQVRLQRKPQVMAPKNQPQVRKQQVMAPKNQPQVRKQQVMTPKNQSRNSLRHPPA